MSSAPRGYLLVSACYQAFTLSDGALRMLVLLHLHAEGRTAWALALVLLPYELAGVLTNLVGGYLGARFGLKATLVVGLLLQVVACAMLTVDAVLLTVPYVMATQVMSGVAKDLAKTSAKSYVRALAPAGEAHGLFRLVAWLTGSKNAIKGLGFFAGGALLAVAGFRATNLALAVLLLVAAALALLRLPPRAGKEPRGGLRQLLQPDAATGWLSAARLFVFGSRDAWFSVALPVFLVGAGFASPWIGAVLSLWVIGYGIVQAATPRWLAVASPADGARRTERWTMSLVLPLLLTAAALWWLPTELQVWALLLGLFVYGAQFAVTSSLHSWLVLALHDDDGGRHVAERVGFYYAANAAGRVFGLLLSGWLFTSFDQGHGGLLACVLASAGAVVLAVLCGRPLHRHVPAATPPAPAPPPVPGS